MMRSIFQRGIFAATLLVGATGLTNCANAQLLVYDPFSYTAGENLGGTDPDGAGPTAGDPTQGQSGTYAAGGGGGSYKWYARGTVSNYQSPNDAIITTGNLSYPGLAASQGNSVSYGSATANSALYADSMPLPNTISIETPALYYSFIIRIKSNTSAVRHSPAALVTDVSDDASAGGALASQSGFGAPVPGAFWMRRDPVIVGVTNFSPGKSNSDGIGPGAPGDSAGWQHSSLGTFVEGNQYGDKDGQPAPDFNTPSTYQTYFVVMKYKFNDTDVNTLSNVDTVSLWMNPGAGTLGVANGEALATQDPTGNVGSYYAAINAVGTATTDANVINSFALIGHRQNVDNTIAIDFDELRVGLTWQDVTPAAAGLLGDFNSDGKVDAGDYATWRKNDGTNNALANDNGLGTPVGTSHYTLWRANFGNPPGSGSQLGGGTSTIPEPATFVLILAGSLWLITTRRFCAG